MNRAERGNILFLILLAVVLFAALSYAVTQSLRGGGKDGRGEKAQAIAAEIVNYTTMMEQTILRLRLKGCSLSQIDFDNPVVSGYDNTAYAPADKRCNVFDPAGGGLAWKTPDPDWFVDSTGFPGVGVATGQWHIPVEVNVVNLGANAPGTLANAKELVIGVAFLRQDICDAILERLGEAPTGSAINMWPIAQGSKYVGAFYNAGSNNVQGIAAGKRTFCLNSSNTGYTFYHVLEAQ